MAWPRAMVACEPCQTLTGAALSGIAMCRGKSGPEPPVCMASGIPYQRRVRGIFFIKSRETDERKMPAVSLADTTKNRFWVHCYSFVGRGAFHLAFCFAARRRQSARHHNDGYKSTHRHIGDAAFAHQAAGQTMPCRSAGACGKYLRRVAHSGNLRYRRSEQCHANVTCAGISVRIRCAIAHF